jgi:hypothetical protein
MTVDGILPMAWPHLVYAWSNAIHHRPHPLDGFPTRASRPTGVVEGVRGVTFADMPHQVHFWDQVRPVLCVQVCVVTKVLRQVVTTLLEVFVELTVHVICVQYRHFDVANGADQAPRHVTPSDDRRMYSVRKLVQRNNVFTFHPSQGLPLMSDARVRVGTQQHQYRW